MIQKMNAIALAFSKETGVDIKLSLDLVHRVAATIMAYDNMDGAEDTKGKFRKKSERRGRGTPG